jgi:hypothetical protein
LDVQFWEAKSFCWHVDFYIFSFSSHLCFMLLCLLLQWWIKQHWCQRDTIACLLCCCVLMLSSHKILLG